MSDGGTTRYTMGGFWDTQQRPGPIKVSNTVGNATAIKQYEKRRSLASQVGQWRKAPCDWKVNEGSYVDPDYYIVDWNGRVT